MWSEGRGEPRPISVVHLPKRGGLSEPVIKPMGMAHSSGLTSTCVAQIVCGSLETGLQSGLLMKADQASGLQTVVGNAPSSQVTQQSPKHASNGYPKMRKPCLLMRAFTWTFPSIINRADRQGVISQMFSPIPSTRGAGKRRATRLRTVRNSKWRAREIVSRR